MDAIWSEHYVTRHDVCSQTRLVKNGSIGVITAQANSSGLREREIKVSPSHLVPNHEVVALGL